MTTTFYELIYNLVTTYVLPVSLVETNSYLELSAIVLSTMLSVFFMALPFVFLLAIVKFALR